MEESKLIEKIIQRKEVISEIDRIAKIVVPQFVTKPIACKVDEWNHYVKSKKMYDEATDQKGSVLESEKKKLKEINQEIINMLPQSCIWFVSNDEKYAVAHRSDDWPSSIGNLLIIENPIVDELTEVHHQIVN